MLCDSLDSDTSLSLKLTAHALYIFQICLLFKYMLKLLASAGVGIYLYLRSYRSEIFVNFVEKNCSVAKESMTMRKCHIL